VIELADNNKPVPYRVLMEYAKKDWPTEPLDKGFTVQRVMRVLPPDSNLDNAGTIPLMSAEVPSPKQGDIVVVDVLIVAQQPTDSVAGADPIPAGFDVLTSCEECVRQSLATAKPPTTFWRAEPVLDRVAFDARKQSAGLFHFRYLARATAPGRYLIPPTRVESRTQPEVFGRTGVSYITVKPKDGLP